MIAATALHLALGAQITVESGGAINLSGGGVGEHELVLIKARLQAIEQHLGLAPPISGAAPSPLDPPPPSSPPPLHLVNSADNPAPSCQALFESGANVSGGYFVAGRTQPTFCDMVALGGGWQKIDPYPGGARNGGGTIDSSNYDLGTVGNYVRITGAVNGAGDFTGAQQPLPDAAEYFVKSRVVQIGGNNARGTITLLTYGAGTNRYKTPTSMSTGAFNAGYGSDEKFVTYFRRMPTPGASYWWSTADGNLNGFAPPDLATLLATPSTAASSCAGRCDGDFTTADSGVKRHANDNAHNSVPAPGRPISDGVDVFFYSPLYSDFSPAPIFEVEVFMRPLLPS